MNNSFLFSVASFAREMFYKIKYTRKKSLFVLFLLFSALVKIRQFLQARSLFIDEANLARNLYERSFSEFFSVLDYEQYAPPLFMVLSKISCELVGYNELGLRLVPLLSALLTLYLFFFLFKEEKLPYLLGIVALIPFTFAWNPMMYATQFKQYGTDQLVVLGLFCLFMKYPLRKDVKSFVFWMLLGALSIFLSMPAVFVLGSIGVYRVAIALQQKNLKSVFTFVPVYAFWLLAFTTYYVLILSKDIGSDYLNNYHASYFIPKNVFSKDGLLQCLHIISNYFQETLGVSVGMSLACFIVSIYGAVALVKKNLYYLVLVFPVVFTWVVSAFQLYSLIPRLLFFGTVATVFSFAYACFVLISDRLWWKKAIGVILVLVVCLNPKLYVDVAKHGFGFSFEETRVPITYAATYSKQEKIPTVVSWHAMPAFKFYTQSHTEKKRFNRFNPVQFNPFWEKKIEDQVRELLTQHAEVWVIYGSQPDYLEQNKNIENEFEILMKCEVDRAASYLVKKK